jgi:hypothetical protein
MMDHAHGGAVMSTIMTEEVPTQETVSPPATSEDLARKQAIKQIQRRRQFQFHVITSAIFMALLVVIWATAEYNNAGGWPSNGFSQSSGIRDTWNNWIIYPFMGWVVFLAVRTWAYYKGASISESEIRREIDRQAGRR